MRRCTILFVLSNGILVSGVYIVVNIAIAKRSAYNGKTDDKHEGAYSLQDTILYKQFNFGFTAQKSDFQLVSV